MKAVVLGCGFVGARLARLFAHADWEVIGVTHSREAARGLANESFRAIACDITDRVALAEASILQNADVAISAVSSGRGDADVYRSLYFNGMQNALEILQPRSAIFVSSTSVYAQRNGEWVTEDSPAEPQRETGRILRETETFVLAQGGIVARLAGIYGPGRSVLLQKFLEGHAVIEGDGQRYINQIHADDAASALFFLIQNRAKTGVYNVVDDTPLTQSEIYEWLAAHFKKPLPPRGAINTHRKRGWTNKRVSNAKLRAVGWEPRFPSFREALSFLL